MPISGSKIISRLIGQETTNNRMYNHAGVLRRYCGLTIPLPVQGFIQHGWSYGPGIPLDEIESGIVPGDLRFRLWNKRNERMCREHGFHNVRIIGAPLLYLVPAVVNISPTTSNSLLLFPDHTSNTEPFSENGAAIYSRYLDEIQPILGSFQSTTICLYWREFDDPAIRRRVEDRGFHVTTLGHRDRTPDFLERFRDLVLRHEYVSTNQYSTALFYALFLNRKAFIHGRAFAHQLRAGRIDSLTQFQHMSQRYPELDWARFGDRCHHNVGAEELGAAYQLEPDEMRRECGWTAFRQLTSTGHRLARFYRRKLVQRAP